VTVGRRDAGAPVTEFSKCFLATPNKRMEGKPVPATKQRQEYTLYRWAHDNSWSALEVTFTLEEVSQLKPGQVLCWAGTRDMDQARGI
jgi:hypothetical protein